MNDQSKRRKLPDIASISALIITVICLIVWDRLSINNRIGSYLDTHPEVVANAINLMNARQREKADDDTGKRIRDNWVKIKDTPAWIVQYDGRSITNRLSTLGREFGPANLNMIATDYRCHFCQGDASAVEALITAHQGVKYAFLETPILGAPSVALADDVLGKADERTYFELHQAGFVRGREEATNPVPTDHPSPSPMLSQQIAAEQLIGINATPTYVLGGKVRTRALASGDGG